MKIIDLHTDFILGQKKLDSLFGVDTRHQINERLALTGGIKTLLAGFSYDDWLGKTDLMLSTTEDYIAKSDGKLNILPHLEGAEILALNKKLFFNFIERGLRSIGLAHTEDNSLCGSSSSKSNLGISPLGKKLIKGSIKERLLVDLAHMSKQSLREALNIIPHPPLISHTACFSIEKNPRNIDDNQIKEISERGGVIGIFFSGKYINSQKKPTVRDVVNHFEHIVEVGGIYSVAIGSDFGGITTGTPIGLESAEKLPNLLKELKNRGYKNRDLERIAYRNAERVMDQYLK
ncbi:MAG: Membrane dipeptidase [Candidatus Woesebacteria bacterium GW2011_GWA2_40_7]|uniref:Membrane dipeptidase n=3 Tax=Candidatus Woeseibacteriota TaxID=1752722 RepID=A0A0G0X7L2_9BACT|nr:MAG: Membrane dipeptidase [Candidatus Woesebacteria bacterium GW2011_GWB1_39_10]KKR74260.1 MAG: Membrane dipeptidase [Candidatus Woesebacteria bacterium GW2011_GWA2_40_7]KKR92635.1 MAG: Membrane dipeptidase [Candidatus Woesebacteria bacterium GW2011_GWA1_41_13b]